MPAAVVGPGGAGKTADEDQSASPKVAPTPTRYRISKRVTPTLSVGIVQLKVAPDEVILETANALGACGEVASEVVVVLVEDVVVILLVTRPEALPAAS